MNFAFRKVLTILLLKFLVIPFACDTSIHLLVMYSIPSAGMLMVYGGERKCKHVT